MIKAKKYYDVVIIGAGPAGLACATGLARSGLSILILEQKDNIGPKVCAGGLTRKNLNHTKIPEDLPDFCFKEMVYHSPPCQSRNKKQRGHSFHY